MKLDIDSHLVTLKCPACGKEVEESIGRLRDSPKLTCGGCGAAINVDAEELDAGIKSVEDQLEALKASLGNLFK